MKYKNYIWDFDGTLFDSYPHICECLLRILEREGVRENFDPEMVMRYLCVSYGAAWTIPESPGKHTGILSSFSTSPGKMRWSRR